MKRIYLHSFLAIFSILLSLQCSTYNDRLLTLNKRVALDPSLPGYAVMQEVFSVYLNIHIADSLQQAVQDSVAALLKRPMTFAELPLQTEKELYASETGMTSLCRDLLVLRARGDEARFSSELTRGLDAAQILNKELGNDYWEGRLTFLKSFSTADALAWLSAYVAEQQCAICYADINKFQEAEQLAALALRNLQHIPDDRLRLDICQRLAVILYRFRGYFHLAFSMLQEGALQAKINYYYLREVGSLYNLANAQTLAGHFEKALSLLNKTAKLTTLYRAVPLVEYYAQKTKISMTQAYYEMGQFQKSLRICENFAMQMPNLADKLDIMINKAYSLDQLGFLDSAVSEYKKIIEEADAARDEERKIVAYLGLARLHNKFLDHQNAQYYGEQALALCNNSNLPEDNDLWCHVLLKLASIYFDIGLQIQLTNTMQELENKVKQIKSPFAQSEWYTFLGKFYNSKGDLDNARTLLKQALEIQLEHSNFRTSHMTRLALIDLYMAQKEYTLAKRKAEELWRDCQDSGHFLLLIDVQAKIADIEYAQHNIHQAIACYNDFFEDVEQVSQRFNDPDYLLLYNQKIYGMLKHAAKLETDVGDYSSALSKLDMSKELFIRAFSQGWRSTKQTFNVNLAKIQQSLQDDELILNYVLQNDALYIYAISADTIAVDSKQISTLQFRRDLIKYLELITSTATLLNSNNFQALDQHHQDIETLGVSLSDIILNWDILQGDRFKTIYILPDDILFEIPFSSLLDIKNNNTFIIQSRKLITIQSLNHFQTYSNQIKPFNQYKILLSLDESFLQAHQLRTFLDKNFNEINELTSQNRPRVDEILAQFSDNYDLYIIVGHSSANFFSPNESQIQCTVRDSNNTRHIVNLKLQDIKKITWPENSIIFLIGCETARGKLYQGTGLASLQRYISILGGQFVVSSMWEVDATFTINQTIFILQQMINGQTLVHAMRASQLELMRSLSNDPYYGAAHPFLWSSLSLLQH